MLRLPPSNRSHSGKIGGGVAVEVGGDGVGDEVQRVVPGAMFSREAGEHAGQSVMLDFG